MCSWDETEEFSVRDWPMELWDLPWLKLRKNCWLILWKTLPVELQDFFLENKVLSWMISKVKTRLVNRVMNVRELGWNKPVMGNSYKLQLLTKEQGGFLPKKTWISSKPIWMSRNGTLSSSLISLAEGDRATTAIWKHHVPLPGHRCATENTIHGTGVFLPLHNVFCWLQKRAL